jgi:hypothetical protein
MWALAAGSFSNWIRSGPWQIYSLGALCALIAAAIALGINIPTANRLGSLAAALRDARGAPTAAQSDLLRRLNARLARGTRIAAILLILATAAMATARYVA